MPTNQEYLQRNDGVERPNTAECVFGTEETLLILGEITVRGNFPRLMEDQKTLEPSLAIFLEEIRANNSFPEDGLQLLLEWAMSAYLKNHFEAIRFSNVEMALEQMDGNVEMFLRLAIENTNAQDTIAQDRYDTRLRLIWLELLRIVFILAERPVLAAHAGDMKMRHLTRLRGQQAKNILE